MLHRLTELDTRRHVKKIADRGSAVLAVLEAWNVSLGQIIDRFDRTVGNGDAHQQAGDRLHHRLRNETVAVGPPILVMLEQDLIVPGDHFGMDGHLRIGFGEEAGYMREGLNRLQDLLIELGVSASKSVSSAPA